MQEATTDRTASDRRFRWEYAVAVLVPALAFVFARTQLQVTRVGDGSEYYALYLAWKETLRPFMTDASWRQYGMFVDTGSVHAMVPLRQLAGQFPALRVGLTADLNHFWAYSGLAAMVSAMASVFGFALAPHTAFLLLHAVLFALVSLIALKVHGRSGLAGVLLMTVCSPMIWFFDKAHTEFFTFCFVLGGVIAYSASRFFLAALLFAVASTQNVSFAAVAVVPLLVDLYRRRHRTYSLFELIALAATALLVLVHPAYYFFREGVIDPQLLAGGARIGANFRVAWVWLFDPDIGLFPNWPLGVVLVVYGLIALRRSRANRRDVWNYAFFCACFLAINLPAQSSTENLNSGATPGLARYATWYIPLFYPAAVSLVAAFAQMFKVQKAVVAVLVGLCMAFTLIWQRPQLSEAGYLSPSPVSSVLQNDLPRVYDPPAEIFSERYGGIGENPALRSAYAIVGPDCRKILLVGGNGAIYGAGCDFAPDLLAATISARVRASRLRPGDYLHLSDADASRATFRCPESADFSKGGNVPDAALSGFSGAESWGRWSDSASAVLTCEAPARVSGVHIHVASFSPGGRPQKVRVSVNHSAAVQFVLDGTKQTLDIPVPHSAAGKIVLAFEFPDALSPKDAGLSDDTRKLGVGVTKIEFTH